MADGRSTISGAGLNDDTRRMAAALGMLGFEVAIDEAAARIVVDGRGGAIPATRPRARRGGAGTAMRFLLGFLTLGRGRFRLDGNQRMRERPIGPLLDAMAALGVSVRAERDNGCPPVIDRGWRRRRARRRGAYRRRGFLAIRFGAADAGAAVAARARAHGHRRGRAPVHHDDAAADGAMGREWDDARRQNRGAGRSALRGAKKLRGRARRLGRELLRRGGRAGRWQRHPEGTQRRLGAGRHRVHEAARADGRARRVARGRREGERQRRKSRRRRRRDERDAGPGADACRHRPVLFVAHADSRRLLHSPSRERPPACARHRASPAGRVGPRMRGRDARSSRRGLARRRSRPTTTIGSRWRSRWPG